MIPKIIHHVWLGNKPFPEEFNRYRLSWMKHHPTWTMMFWDEDNLPKLINQNSLKLCNTYSEMSDVIRYELLYKYGGIYLDCDFSCYKNVEPLIKDLKLFISTEDNVHLSGGFIGSVPKHPIIKRLIRLIPKNLEMSKGKTSDLRIGPKWLTNNVRKDEITILPKEYFYPYLPWEIEKKENLKKNKICYAAHHWKRSWGESI